MNRGSAPKLRWDHVIHLASMRPRFMNRGSGIQRQELLADGACFNEAPIHESGKFEPRVVALPQGLPLQ